MEGGRDFEIGDLEHGCPQVAYELLAVRTKGKHAESRSRLFSWSRVWALK